MTSGNVYIQGWCLQWRGEGGGGEGGGSFPSAGPRSSGLPSATITRRFLQVLTANPNMGIYRERYQKKKGFGRLTVGFRPLAIIPRYVIEHHQNLRLVRSGRGPSRVYGFWGFRAYRAYRVYRVYGA